MTVKPHDIVNCQTDNCFLCKCATLRVSASAMPTRRAVTSEGLREERRLAKDLPAYKRLRMEGMQPRSTTNAAKLEATANSRYEVETGHRFDSPKDATRADKLNRDVQYAIATGTKVEL